MIRRKKIGQKQPNIAGLKRAINAGSTFCGAQPVQRRGEVVNRPGFSGDCLVESRHL